MLRFLVYPKALGLALIRSMLKPGKPPALTSSLRGIRLLNSLAAWFSQLLDQRARQIWQAGAEQFGFRSAIGCADAVIVLLALIYSRTFHRKRLFVLWVDLRTAFPSLNRPLLIQRLFQCGFTYGFCRLVMSMFELTRSAVVRGANMSDSFLEQRGTREGSVEGPHQFNVFISPLRERLESQHHRLCQLMSVTIAVLLYADDAAIPADSAEDLALSARILEQFCNDSQLFISTSKTFLTVFHHESDDGVEYKDQTVFVDGAPVLIEIYGTRIVAVPEFKYLGIVIDAVASVRAHATARLSAFQRASRALLRGLMYIHGYSSTFATYLWTSMVEPVAHYGFEVFS